MRTVTVSGPGVERTLQSPAIGLSAAITYASASARQREEASYYVRTDDDSVVGRADALADGSVSVYGERSLR